MPTVTRRPYAAGFAARDPDNAQNPQYLAIIDTFVCDFYLEDLFPSNGTTMPASTERNRIDAVLEFARTTNGVNGKPLTVVLRPRAGFYIPQWLRNASTMMPWYTNNGLPTIPAARKGGPAPSDQPGDALSALYIPGQPVWWVQPYWDALKEMHQTMAARWGSHPNVSEIEAAYPSTQFMEPCNHQGSFPENVFQQMSNGWSVAAEDAAFHRGWRDAMDVWGIPYGITVRMAFNPLGTYSGTTPATYRFQAANDEARTYRLMREMIAECTYQGVEYGAIGNNSFDDSWTAIADHTGSGKAEVRMWDFMQTLRQEGHAICFQTETMTKMKSLTPKSTVLLTVRDAIAIGSYRVEGPTGWQDPANAPDYYAGPASYAAPNSAALIANAPALPSPPAADPRTRVGVIKGQTGTSAVTSYTASMPAGIPANSVAVFEVSAQSTSDLTVSGLSGTPVFLRTDGVGTNFPSWLVAVPVGPSDSGVNFTLSFAANNAAVPPVYGPTAVRSTTIGEVWSKVAMPVAADVAFVTETAGSGTMTMPALSGDRFTVVAAARMATGTTTVALPNSPTNADAVATLATTGVQVSAVIGDATVAAGVITSSPVAQKMAAYALSLRVASLRFSLWNGTSEVPLTATVYTGAAEVAVGTVSVA